MSKIYFFSIVFILSTNLHCQFNGINLALNKPATASSAIQPASNAVDGNYTTRWESEFSDNSKMKILISF
jgi:ABC-type Fe2+-enterobactin transport system substrate-binding protein